MKQFSIRLTGEPEFMLCEIHSRLAQDSQINNLTLTQVAQGMLILGVRTYWDRMSAGDAQHRQDLDKLSSLSQSLLEMQVPKGHSDNDQAPKAAPEPSKE